MTGDNPTVPSFIATDVALAPMTTLGVGGPARYFADIDGVMALTDAFRWASDNSIDIHVLGDGSNLVVSDSGFDGLVLRISSEGVATATHGDEVKVTAAAGENWDGLVERCVSRDLGGVECLSGIPGRVGAAPIQNIGAYGQELSSVVEAVRCFDRHSGVMVTFDNGACEFGYRMSRFKSDPERRFVVVEVTFALAQGAPPEIRYRDIADRLCTDGRETDPSLAEVRETVLDVRRSKSMVLDDGDPNSRSAGSFFVNPVVDTGRLEEVRESAAVLGVDPATMPAWATGDGRSKLSAAWLIEHSGFGRGYGDGPAGLSANHTLAIVNRGDATASDIVSVAARVRLGVRSEFGVEISPEPEFLGFGRPAGEVLDDV